MPDLDEALAPVLRDVAATTDLVLHVEDADWTDLGPSAYVSVPGCGQTGVYLPWGTPDHEAVFVMADKIQEIVIENIAGRASNWPSCPEHPATHPMGAVVVEREGWWACPTSGTRAVRVGELRL